MQGGSVIADGGMVPGGGTVIADTAISGPAETYGPAEQTYPMESHAGQVPVQTEYPVQQYPSQPMEVHGQQQYPQYQQQQQQQPYPVQQQFEQGPARVYEPFQHPTNPLYPATGRVPAGVPTAQSRQTVPATPGNYYPAANAGNRYRQVKAQVPVVAGKQSNLFGPTGYDELK